MSTLIDGLWAALEFDNASGQALDSHTQGLHLTDVNTVQRVAGLLGNAAFFEKASNEYFSSLNTQYSLANIGTSFTFAFWLKGANSITGDNFVFNKNTSTASQREWYVHLRVVGGVRRLDWALAYNAVGGLNQQNTGAVGLFSNADWDLVMLWRDNAAGTMNIQINNGAIVSGAVSGPPNAVLATPFSVGRLQYAANANNVTMDNAWIWNRVLTVAERTEFFNAGASITYASIASAPPADPTLLTATATASTKIALGWNDESDDEVGFVVEQSIDNNTAYAEIHTTAADVESYIVTGLIPGRRYFHRVKARNAEGDSGYTNETNTVTLFGPLTSTFTVEEVTSTFTVEEVTSTFTVEEVTSTFTEY